MKRKRVLLVSYHFPPVGGAGVQRIAKFARYLPEFGWDVSVLQAANPSVPLLDQTLLDDLPVDTVIVKARTLEPAYAAKQQITSGESTGGRGGARSLVSGAVRGIARRVLQPDAQVLWLPAARKAGLALLGRLKHDAILATAPTYTNLVLGRMLKRRTGLPLITDYRDEWDLSSAYWENAPRDRFSHLVQQSMQRRVLRATDAIVATTQASTDRLLSRAREAGSDPLARCIYNGWDRGDLAAADLVETAVPRAPGRFRLVYAGTLWNLTSIAPVVDAILLLTQSRPELTERLELVVLGRKTPEQETHLRRLEGSGVQLALPEYASHAVALATMKSADALLLLLSDVPGAERVAPAKLFEYLAVRRPILAVMPDGETAGLVREVYRDGWRSPTDLAGITEWLTRRLSTPESEAESQETADEGVDRFERRHLSGQLAALLDQVTGGAS